MTTFATSLKFSRMGISQTGNKPESEASDLELLKQVQAQSRRALEGLYDRYSAKALGLAFKTLRDRDLAEEVVVEAFWRVWQRADQFQFGRGSFASWFYGIVRHLAIDELRRRETRPAPSADEQLEMAFAADVTRGEDLTETVVRSLNADLVQNAIKALPQPQRQVIQLAYLDGLTREEISKKLGQPLGTVHTRARLGLDKLRVILNGTQ